MRNGSIRRWLCASSTILGLVALAASCSDGSNVVDMEQPDAGGVARPPVTEEHAGGYQADDAWIFSDEVVHTIELTLPAASIAALETDPRTWAAADVWFDGEPVPAIGVRLRGKIGSFRPLGGKPKFKLKFNQMVTDQRFHGLEALALNNAVVDCSYLKDPLAYRIFALHGVPTERTGFARVFVNGADYGLYVLVEVPDDRFLRRVYPDHTGNLYDGKYVWYGGSSYQLLDFNRGLDELFGLEEGVDIGHQDISGISSALATWAGSGQLVSGLDPVLDWDELHRFLAVEQWVGHNDGYALNTNNYRVYFEPSDGRAELIPWDLDYGFLNDFQWGKSWASPQGQLAAACFSDAGCALEHKAAVQGLLDAVDPAEVMAWLERVDALTYEAAATDPRRECSAAGIAPSRQALRSWVEGQNDRMRAFWGL